MNAREVNFAYKIRNALNEHLDALPVTTTERLANARKKALAIKRADKSTALTVSFRALAGGFGGAVQHSSWLSRAGLVIPLIALLVGLSGIYNFEKQNRLSETADIDAAVLSDELPLNAYLDQGFSAYLARHVE